ncbi:Nuclear receptor-binding protein-like [Armadillidium vulgare]|nr:Nuclear receptor-binding protein-like [Armadillidium vulgare]
MSSGSLKKFLKLTKRNVKKLPLQSWKRWCTQILSALSYLHSCTPPIVHGNLTTDSIFIQHNGLVKIGSVAPDAIQTHVKTCRGDMKNMHYIAPEYASPNPVTPAVDIYSFGMCALEIAALEIPGNGDSGNHISQEQIQKTIHSLEHKLQQDFINKCLNPDPKQRPFSTKLLFHPVLFEVHSLKLLAAHNIIHNPKKANTFMDNNLEDMLQKQYHPDSVVAELPHPNREPTYIKMSDIPVVEKLEKFMEDVRLVIASLLMTLSLRLDDKMNRQLSCVLQEEERAAPLADELVKHGFINQIDKDRVVCMIDSELTRYRNGGIMPEVNGDVYPISSQQPHYYGVDPNFIATLPPTISSR